jgi:hypothetical protein
LVNVSNSVRRICFHSTKCLILYHFVLCIWCYCTNHCRRLWFILLVYYRLIVAIQRLIVDWFNIIKIRCPHLLPIFVRRVNTAIQYFLSMRHSRIVLCYCFNSLMTNNDNISVEARSIISHGDCHVFFLQNTVKGRVRDQHEYIIYIYISQSEK